MKCSVGRWLRALPFRSLERAPSPSTPTSSSMPSGWKACQGGCCGGRSNNRSSSIGTAHHVEQCLSLLVGHHGHGTLDGARQLGRIVNALTITTCRHANLLECRQPIELCEGRSIAFGGFARGYMPTVNRRTAFHMALFITTNRTGSSCRAAAWWTAAGLLKR